MEISLRHLAKRYNKEWIFKDLSLNLKTGGRCALIGPNGSGKSTLLQIISGYHLPSSGQVIYTSNGKNIAAESIYKYLSVSTPYMELIEDFTLLEHLKFHFKFRKLREGVTMDAVIESCYLQDSKDKVVKNFSSGMKQRLKLALAFYTDSAIVLLDEPTSNLDSQGVEWYQEKLIELGLTKASVIIASNQPYEYENYCNEAINLKEYK